jgi:two-component system chemotaxis response regulator CheB
VPVGVMVVDDSAFMRWIVTDLLQSDPALRVVAHAVNGQDALAKLPAVDPDVITLDVDMPVMGGLEALERIMRERPRPVVMLSSLTYDGASTTLRALELGAVDFVGKPRGPITGRLDQIRDELTSKVAAAAKVPVSGLNRLTHPQGPSPATGDLGKPEDVVVIGASTGGPKALAQLFSSLPQGFAPAMLLVQHMPTAFVDPFSKRLDALGPVSVRTAQASDTVTPGTALVAPGGHHMTVDRASRVFLTEDPPVWGVRPAVDLTMISAAEAFMERTVGVVLTGMGRDGAAGIQAVHHRGGRTIAESEETSMIYGMPRAAIETGCVDRVARIEQMTEAIVSTVRRAREHG